MKTQCIQRVMCAVSTSLLLMDAKDMEMTEQGYIQPPKILDVNPLTIRFYCDATDLRKILDWDGGPPMWWDPFLEALEEAESCD